MFSTRWLSPLARLNQGRERAYDVDPDRAKECIRRFFKIYGVDPAPPIVWTHDAVQGYIAAGERGSSERSAIPSLESQSEVQFWGRADIVGAEEMQFLKRRIKTSTNLACWLPAEEAALLASRRVAEPKVRSSSARAFWDYEKGAPRSAALSAIGRSSRGRDGGAREALLEAWEAGLWVYWILDDIVVAVPKPRLRIQDGRLHSEDAPAAVSWPNGEGLWFWRGVQVQSYVILRPDHISFFDIRYEPNVERRRVLIERFGMEKYLKALGGKVIHADDRGVLYRAVISGEREPLVMVKVVNSTPEPDGSRREFFIRVPPNVYRASDAVAWSFEISPEAYKPVVET